MFPKYSRKVPESILKNGYNSLPRGSSSHPGQSGPESFRLRSSQTTIRISVQFFDTEKLGHLCTTGPEIPSPGLLYTIVGMLVFINQYII